MTQDLRYSIRLLLRHRRSTVATVLMLGLGLGANAALFVVVNAAFLRPLPFRDPDRLVFLYASFPGSSAADLANFSYPDFDDVRRSATSFEAIAAHTNFTAAAIETSDGPARVQPNFVDGPYFEILGAQAEMGRVFTEEETRTGARLMVLSHGTWERIFGANRSILGQSVRINGVAFEVIGIMPRSFFDLAERGGQMVDLWLPVRTASAVMSTFDPASRSGRLLWGVARLREGVSAAAADHDLGVISTQLQQQFPDTNRGFAMRATPVRNIFFTEMREPLQLLAAGAAFVLLIVCCNVAVMLVARGAARQRELAIRLALGASRARIVRQLLSESLLLSLAGAAVSLAAAVWGTKLLLAAGGIEFPGFVDVGLDGTVVSVVLGLAAIAGLGAGILPAISGWRGAAGDRLTAAGSVRVVRRPTLQLVLVCVQVAAAVVLVAGAWLMIGSSLGLAQTGLNFDIDRLLTIRIDLPADRYSQPGNRARFGAALREGLAAVPGVESATLWGPGTPGRATWVAFVAPESRVIHSAADFQMVWRHSTNPGGLRDLGIRLIEGRDFSSADTIDTPLVVIVGRSVSGELWPGGTAIGQRMRTGTAPSAPLATVIGVADDVWMRGRFRFGDLDPRRIPQRDIYFSYGQRPQAGLVLLVRTIADPVQVTGSLRAAVSDMDPSLPAYDVRTMDAILLEEERQVRFAALLMSTYGAMALLLAGCGVYAVLAFTVVRRTREIGLRMALGAARMAVVAEVTRSGLLAVVVGSAAGLAVVAALTPVVRTLLFNVSPLDPRILVVTCALLAIAALIASAIPGWRAASIDPAEALRGE